MISALSFAVLGAGCGLLVGALVAKVTWDWPRSQLPGCDDAASPVRASTGSRGLAIMAAAAVVGGASLLTLPGIDGLGGAIFGWLLLALLVLDIEHFWLPNRLTIPLAVAGLLAGIWFSPEMSSRAVGAIAGFVSLAGIALGYRAVTGRVGLGGGDPRLFAGIGAWLGWAALPFVLLLAAALGLALVARDRLSGRMVTRYTRVPLGALLAASAWLVWLAGTAGIWEHGV